MPITALDAKYTHFGSSSITRPTLQIVRRLTQNPNNNEPMSFNAIYRYYYLIVDIKSPRCDFVRNGRTPQWLKKSSTHCS